MRYYFNDELNIFANEDYVAKFIFENDNDYGDFKTTEEVKRTLNTVWYLFGWSEVEKVIF